MSYEAWGEPDGRPFPKPAEPLACMGGWCALRDHCQHYHAANRETPAERLCTPGLDGHSDIEGVSVTQPPRVIRIATREDE
jgi:hypothetical protein